MSSSSRSGSTALNSARHSGCCAKQPGLRHLSARRSTARSSRSRSPRSRRSSCRQFRPELFACQTLATDVEPDTGVDLKKGRIAGRDRHGRLPAYAVSFSRPRRRLAVRPCRKVSRIELAEYVDQSRHDPGPPGLMAGADAGAVVAMEVFVEQQVVPPVRIALEFLGRRRTPAAVRSRRAEKSGSADWRSRGATSKRFIKLPEPVGHSILKLSP